MESTKEYNLLPSYDKIEQKTDSDTAKSSQSICDVLAASRYTLVVLELIIFIIGILLFFGYRNVDKTWWPYTTALCLAFVWYASVTLIYDGIVAVSCTMAIFVWIASFHLVVLDKVGQSGMVVAMIACAATFFNAIYQAERYVKLK